MNSEEEEEEEATADSSIVPSNNLPASTTDEHGNSLNYSNKPPKPLTIKTSLANKISSKQSPASVLSNSDSFKNSIRDLAPYSSPSLISPPSSAFVSALQSPYISPRALIPGPPPAPEEENPNPPQSQPSPPVSTSYSGSQSEGIPSSSYTPPPERSDFSDDGKPKNVTCIPVQGPDGPTAPRISFSFQVPRISFAKGSVSPAVNAKLRSCDVFIGYHGQNTNLVRFCKWLKSELELQGIACFVADRAKYADSQSHEIADRVICSVTFGVVVVSGNSLFNHFSMEEIRFFAQKKNLIPIFFETEHSEVTGLLNHNTDDKERRETIEGMLKLNEFKLEAKSDNWRSCISRAASILTSKLGRKSIAEKEVEGAQEFPFPRNKTFVGREKELTEMESTFFGSGDSLETESQPPVIKGSTSGQSEGFADEESDRSSSTAGYTSFEMANKKSKGPHIDTWAEPGMVRDSSRRAKYKKSKSGKDRGSGSSIICISGPPGIGKTEIALEFAHRFSHRYRMVLWVGGEAQHMRQNILNLSLKLGLDVSADPEKERGRLRSFEEQEFEAFKRVKREIFRDMPYLLIIDNLENEYEWWEGKDLKDLIPRNIGGSHVIITTRASKMMGIDPIQLQPLPSTDAVVLIRGRRKKDYPVEEFECLKKFDEKLGRSTFGLCVVGSLLSELAISPSALYEAVNGIILEEAPSPYSSFWTTEDQQFWRNNYFLMKLLGFCFAVLEKANERRNCLASRMLSVGAWFAPAPTSASLLAIAAKNIPAAKNQLKIWTKCLNIALGYCAGCPLANQTWKVEEESAFLLARFGLARKSTRQPEVHIQMHPVTQIFARRREGSAVAARAMILGVRRLGNSLMYSDHLWASAFLVFGYKTEPPLVQLKATDMVLFIKKTALPLAIRAFATYSRCSSALDLLKLCTNVLEEVEKSFVSQIQDWCHGSLCWKKRFVTSQTNQQVDEYVWQDVTLLKATLLETRAKLLLRGGLFDSAEELCRTCISIRTVMLGHNHAQTLASQETLAKLVRFRSKI